MLEDTAFPVSVDLSSGKVTVYRSQPHVSVMDVDTNAIAAGHSDLVNPPTVAVGSSLEDKLLRVKFNPDERDKVLEGMEFKTMWFKPTAVHPGRIYFLA